MYKTKVYKVEIVDFSETIHLVIFGQILPMKPSIFSKWFQDFPKKEQKKC